MAKILLMGMDELTANQIARLLIQENHQIERAPMSIQSVQTTSADLVLASGDDRNCLTLLPSFRAKRAALPIVMVTRLPEARRWLDAIEAGASDYWAAPFERIQFRWLLDSAVNSRQRAAAA